MRPQRFGGEIRIEITGPRCEQLVNLAVTRGIPLWDLTRENDALRAWIDPGDFSSLRPLVRETGCSVHILQRRGFAFWWRQFFRRRSMVIGLVLCLLLVVFMSCFVWVIEVEGAEEVEPEIILQVAREEGLVPGSWRHDLDLTDLARTLERRIPAVTWVGLHMQGVRLTIEVVDKAGYRGYPSDVPVDIVAAEDATIEEMYVLAGIPAVTEGMAVSAGDVLIRGKGSVSASGTVRGLVRHTGRAEVQLNQKVMVPTGRKVVDVFIGANGLQLPLGWGNKLEEFPFEHYRVRREVRTAAIGWPEPVTVEIERWHYEELSIYARDFTGGEAKQIALAEATRRMHSGIPRHASVLETETSVTLRDNAAVAEVQGVILQDVGVERPIELEDDGEEANGE